MKHSIILISIAIMISILCGQQTTWNHTVAISIQSSDGHIPFGKSVNWFDKPGWGKCNWLDDGINFSTWITDIETGEDSDGYYPGDQEYNFNYYPNAKEGYNYGVWVTALDSYEKKGRKEKLGFLYDDILHIRFYYDNPMTGRREIWYVDTAFADTLAFTGYTKEVILRPIEKSDINIYECFADGYKGDDVPKDFYFNAISGDSNSDYITAISFGIPEKTEASLKVFDTEGKLLKEIFDVDYLPGKYEINWLGYAEDGYKIKPGIFIVKFKAGKFSSEKKIIYLG